MRAWRNKDARLSSSGIGCRRRMARVSYQSGSVNRVGNDARLAAITVEADRLPDDVLALLDHHLVDLAGTYGDPERGRAGPVRRATDREHGQAAVEIVGYNGVPWSCSRPSRTLTVDPSDRTAVHGETDSTIRSP